MRERAQVHGDRRALLRGIALLLLLVAAYLVISIKLMQRMSPANYYHRVFASTDRYWEKAKETDYRSVPELIAQHQSELRRQMGRDTLMYGTPSKREIALTFDDGPHPGYTEQILAILKKYDVKATFFLVGEMAEKHPELVMAEVTAGHNIGNHTYHHVNLTQIPTGYVATEVEACNEVLQSITSKPVHLFRPPGGDYNDSVREVGEVLDLRLILWTDDPGDYASPGAQVIKDRIMRDIGNGGIILIHDGVQQTLDALPDILQTLKDRGYKFVTIDQMLTDAGMQVNPATGIGSGSTPQPAPGTPSPRQAPSRSGSRGSRR